MSNGYSTLYNEEELKTYCVFDDGSKCDAKEFLDRTCGQEYVKSEGEIPCREEEESLYWPTKML